jgi:hypothetical protein
LSDLNSNIFNEIDEDLRRERALKLWKAYGNYVIGAAVLIVAATAGYVGWEDYSRKQAEAAATQYVTALDQAKAGKADDAGKALAGIAQSGHSGYAVLAKLEEAGIKASAGDAAGAAAIYRQVAANTSLDAELRDAATLMAAIDSVDTAAPGEIDKEVAGLAAPTSPWRYLAWEVQALAALKAGKVDDARTLYAKISDDADAPASLRARAAEMLAALAG